MRRREPVPEERRISSRAAIVGWPARRVSATCGVSPIQFVQRIRLETARLLLETTRLSVDEIARRVGYAEPSTLRRLIRRDTKHPPGHFRPVA
nr:helix-turn-helix domain-containing protein [Bradyrhizobium sp. 157]